MHLPFCARRCPYCDFATAGLERAVEARYLAALARELRERLPADWRARTAFLGGGTPAELSTPGVSELIAALGPVTRGAQEVTLEANPRTLLPRKLRALQEGLGVNRLSLGVQSFDPEVLKTLGRFHTAEDAREAVALARELGIGSLSLDLIFAVPGQSPADLDRDLGALLELAPDHVSTYCLTFEEGTPFWEARARGELRAAGDTRQARYYARVRQRLRAAGYQHYEISSFARPGHRCAHNRIYWRNHGFYGVGNGAASHLGGVRTSNHRDVAAYAQAVESGAGPIAERDELSAEQKIRETAYLALRTSEGIVPARFERDTGVDPRAFFATELEKLEGLGLLTTTGERIHLSGRGVSVADSVAVEIL